MKVRLKFLIHFFIYFNRIFHSEILDSLVSSADYLDIANLLRMINIMNIVLRMRRFDRSAHQRGTQAELTHEEQVKLLDEID